MKISIKKALAVGVTAIVLCSVLSAVANAGTVLKYTGLGYGDYAGRKIHYGSAVESNVFIGSVKIQVSEDGGITYGAVKHMLCIDLAGRLPQTSAQGNPWEAIYEVVDYSPSTNDIPPGVIDARAWDMVANAVDTYLPTLDNNTDGARLQAVVWEVMRDKSSDSSGLVGPYGSTGNGNFWIESSTAPSWVSGIDAMFTTAAGAASGYGMNHSWYRAANDSYQDLVFFEARPGEIVPEIPAYLLGPLGLAAFGAIRRKLSK